MKLKSIIRSNHDLKKNGYQILAKLHKLELKKNLDKAYSRECSEGYYFVLACNNLAYLISTQYGEEICGAAITKFNNRSQEFIAHLEEISERKCCINRRILSSYLRAYTLFFNSIIEKHVPFSLSQEILIQWNVRCVMAYVTAWGA